jgi:hypothetical protein
MPTLNRFPLLGLWAKEAARRVGYSKGESAALGHTYAVLYAIRAAKLRASDKGEEKTHKSRPRAAKEEQVVFGGDYLDVVRDEEGHIEGHVGHGSPQTPHSFEASVRDKYPPGYYEKLERAFRDVLCGYPRRVLREGRLLYNLYDNWKKACGVGRSVDFDRLLKWCREHKPQE